MIKVKDIKELKDILKKKPKQDIDISNLETLTGAFRYLVLTDDMLKAIMKLDVSHIKDFSYCFFGSECKSTLDLSKWNVSNALTFDNMFTSFRGTIIGLDDWDVSKSENFTGMFMSCKSLDSDLSKWDVSNGRSFNKMFDGCQKSTFRDISFWYMTKAEDVSNMFANTSIDYLDLSGSTMHNVIDMNHMFSKSVIEFLNVNNLVNYSKGMNDFSYMFNQAVIRYIKIDGWNLSRYNEREKIIMDYMFSDISILNMNHLQPLKSWDMSNVVSIDSMFSGVKNLNLDLSDWRFMRLESMEKAFSNCYSFNCDISKWFEDQVNEGLQARNAFEMCLNLGYACDKLIGQKFAFLHCSNLFKVIDELDDRPLKDVILTFYACPNVSIDLGKIYKSAKIRPMSDILINIEENKDYLITFSKINFIFNNLKGFRVREAAIKKLVKFMVDVTNKRKDINNFQLNVHLKDKCFI